MIWGLFSSSSMWPIQSSRMKEKGYLWTGDEYTAKRFSMDVPRFYCFAPSSSCTSHNCRRHALPYSSYKTDQSTFGHNSCCWTKFLATTIKQQ
ncbi:hypothetical protein CICLE_v10017312mg [Citrus x clementina]|uniref:Uncharacterized protein n=1 Tax=Citrus clementina TaxID=85681 RepID=V4UAI0_CITCL|nr:hypothetical protein CICLE_v10017312mg [Citrus x clementina]